MSKIDDGGSAFPHPSLMLFLEPEGGGNSNPGQNPGMSLRDWFAGQALAGLLAGGFAAGVPHDKVSGGALTAGFAFMYADAMIEAKRERADLENDVNDLRAGLADRFGVEDEAEGA